MGLPLLVSVLLVILPLLNCVSTASPSVVLDVTVRNNVDSLPYHLYYLQQLDYPKDKLSVRIHVLDHTNRTSDTALAWERTMKQDYRELTVTFEQVAESSPNQDEEEWKETEFRVWRARQNSLDAARAQGIDFIFLLDADTILEDPGVLNDLIAENHPIVAPLLKDTDDFWLMKHFNFYDDDMEQFEGLGSFKVYNVHWAVLLALDERTNLIQFEPLDDRVTLKVLPAAAAKIGVPLQVLISSRAYGRAPCEHIYGVGRSFTHIIMDQPHLKRLPYVEEVLPATDNMGFDAVYVINLARRPDRRMKMERDLRLLGMKAQFFQAIDGSNLSKELLEKMDIHQLPGYLDPFTQRPMTMGEIGCFMSHYNIWKEAEKNDYKNVLILEDDARFRPHFKLRARQALFEAYEREPDWDLLYLARKPMKYREDSIDDPQDINTTDFNELFVPDSNLLVYPMYSYWALGYALSRSGIQKLLSGEPLKKMIPVDELLPLLYSDTLIEDKIVEQFAEHPRLKALAIYPPIIHPVHYRGQTEYNSDTEHTYEEDQQKGQRPMQDIEHTYEEDQQKGQHTMQDTEHTYEEDQQKGQRTMQDEL